jgi:hypothetical protein
MFGRKYHKQAESSMEWYEKLQVIFVRYCTVWDFSFQKILRVTWTKLEAFIPDIYDSTI